MRKFKRIVAAVLALCVAFCCASCVRMDVGLEIKKDGTASMSAKVMLEEDLYNMLASLDSIEDESQDDFDKDEEELEDPEDAEETEDEILGDEESLDLSEFVKETVDGKTYYSYTSEAYNFATYTEAVEKLMELELADGMSLFKAIEIANDKESRYSFKATTAVIDTDSMEGDGSIEMPDDWCVLTLTVKMPGEVTETNGEKLEDGSVRFNINNFTEENGFYIMSEDAWTLSPVHIVAWVVGGIAIVFCLYKIFSSRKKDEENTEEENEEAK